MGRGTGGGMPGESGNAQLFINGPTENMNGALDYLSQFKVTGGYLLAVGSSGMAEAPGEDSTQYVLMVNFDKACSAGTLARIEDEDGNGVLTFAPAKQSQSVVLCSADLKEGATGMMGGTGGGMQHGDRAGGATPGGSGSSPSSAVPNGAAPGSASTAS